jgi:hypothetical protein
MSPEQARAEKVDGRSDLYSLGAVLFEMLTRRPPYEASDPFTVALMHVTQPVPELPRECNWLQPLVDGLMSKAVDARVATGEEFIHQVEQLLAAAPEAASIHQARSSARKRTGSRLSHTPTQRGNAVRGAGRPRWLLPVLAGTVLLVAIALGAWWWGAEPAPGQGGTTVADPAPAASQPGSDDAGVRLDDGLGSLQMQAGQGTAAGDDIGMLLMQADSYLQAGTTTSPGRRLLFPDDDSAVGLYRRVLQLEPGNAKAREGLQKVADFYLGKARELCERTLWSACLLNVSQGLGAVPDDPELLKLKQVAERGQRGG